MPLVRQKAPMAMRLEQVVDVLYGGNETAAAEDAGVQQSTLHRILAEITKDPKISTLQMLADGFGVPVEWLMGQTDLSATPEDHWIDKYGLPDWFSLLYRQWRKRTRTLREKLSEAGLQAHTPYAKELVALVPPDEGPWIDPGWEPEDVDESTTSGSPKAEMSNVVSAVLKEHINNGPLIREKGASSSALMPLVRADLEADALRLEMLASELRRLARKGEITHE